MPTNEIDPYLALLEAREEEFSSRDSAIKREEEEHRAKGEAIRQRREAFDLDYSAHTAAFQSYKEFLNKRGAPALAHPVQEPVQAESTEFPSLRIEGQRKTVLAHLGEATRRGQRITSRQIVAATGVPAERVSNVLWKDQQRGYVTRVGDFVAMSSKGMEFLKQAGVIDADA